MIRNMQMRCHAACIRSHIAHNLLTLKRGVASSGRHPKDQVAAGQTQQNGNAGGVNV